MGSWPTVWEARWIWAGAPPVTARPFAPAGVPPKETWNRFCYLRRAFDLASVPPSAPARITADSRFILYLNGIEVARGPARSIPERLAWTEIDLAPGLRSGRNAIAALVRFYGAPNPYWIPATPSAQLGYGSFAFECSVINLVSDSSWRGRSAPYSQDVRSSHVLPMVPMEVVDGTGIPAGWTEPEFDDSKWDPATELQCGTLSPNRTRIPVEPYTAPEYADLAPLTADAVTLAPVSEARVPKSEGDDPLSGYPAAGLKRGADGDELKIYDAGRITIATPLIEARGRPGALIDVYCGENLRDDEMVEIGPRFYALRYSLAGNGTQRIEGFEAVGFRYLAIAVRGGSEIVKVSAVERRYPTTGDAAFACDDEQLTKIWRVGARTLECCSTDAFLDCPGREQRAWLGDSYVHALLTYVTNTDWRLVRRHLRICAYSRRGDGLLGMVAAGDATITSTTIPDYSLHWVRALARYFEYSGDAETIRELIPTAAGIVAAFERYRGHDGLLRGMPGWIFIDWAMTERAEVVGALDALYAAALDDYASMLEGVIGDGTGAQRARRQAEHTREAFEILWDERRGVYVDAADSSGPLRRISQQTNAIAILAGCAPRERWNRILNCILDEQRLVITPTIADQPMAYFTQRLDPAEYQRFDAETNVVAAQPFFSHFLHQAVVKAGRRELIPELCARWWPQIERGNTTFEEYWDARSGTGSKCHAWSATPTYDLTTHVLGIRPLEPGYRRAEIRPLFGKLKHITGKLPTPHGMIEIDLTRNGGTIVIPDGVTAELSFEDCDLSARSLSAGRHAIEKA